MRRAARSSFVLVIQSLVAVACAPSQQMADLGDFRLESGEIIRNCRVGYRTAGRLNASRSNAVLVTPWFQGTSGQLVRQIGAGKLVDSSKYFVILVDALGNGVSSSPSNSRNHQGSAFPRISIRDMVESQYQLLTRVLKLTHVRAIVGISMGGMQVFQWITAHPDFMNKAVSIVGSPQSQTDDQLRWKALIRNVQDNTTWQRTKGAFKRGAPRAALYEFGIHANDHVRQAQAAMAMDVSSSFDGSIERAVAAIRTHLLVVGTMQDPEVNNLPAFEFARLAKAEAFELDGRCGHQAPSCERATLWPLVTDFLSK
jgi:homoserine O-acetyltransferase